jgi:hypothetical protein
VAQIAQAAETIAIDTRGAGAVTVHLQPAELGAVSIRVARTTSGTASVDVTVERSTTLQALQSDLAHLHQALDRAGVAENRSITLHMATTGDTGGGQPGRSQGSDPGGMIGQGSPGQGGSSTANGQGGGAPGQQGQARPQTASTTLPHPSETAPAARPASHRRAGVNITA